MGWPTSPRRRPASSPAARRSGWRWPGRWPRDPRLLLLDEPLAALDARTRLDVRAELRRHLADVRGPAVLVTHDPVDAMVLADRVVVLEDGRVVQERHAGRGRRAGPRTDYVARLVGLNLYRGTRRRRPGRRSTAAASWSLRRARRPGAVLVAVRPSAVALHLERPGRQPAQRLAGAGSAGVDPAGDRVRVALDRRRRRARRRHRAAVAELGLAAGREVWAR